MFAFKQFIVETTTEGDEQQGKSLTHLTHVEDHVIHNGHPGVAIADHHLMGMHDKLLGKKSPLHASSKWDGCVKSDTIITTTTGPKTIIDIIENWSLAHPSDVYGIDTDGNVIVTGVIDVQKTKLDKKWISIETDQGSIVVTEDHEILTEAGWKPAEYIDSNDDIISWK